MVHRAGDDSRGSIKGYVKLPVCVKAYSIWSECFRRGAGYFAAFGFSVGGMLVCCDDLKGFLWWRNGLSNDNLCDWRAASAKHRLQPLLTLQTIVCTR